jgi:predicted AAA+ superfamily ATPase
METPEPTLPVLLVLADLAGLTVYRDSAAHPLLRTFRSLLEEGGSVAGERPLKPEKLLALLRCWAKFVRALAEQSSAAAPTGASFFSAVRDIVLFGDNQFTRTAEAAGSGASSLPPLLAQLARDDLDRLGRIAAFDVSALGFAIALRLRAGDLEDAAAQVEAAARGLWQLEGQASAAAPEEALFAAVGPWGESLGDFVAYLRRHGAGPLGRYGFFRWAKAPGAVHPVLNPDPVRLADLSGYEDQRSMVIANTLAFLEGKAANNLLLYGDRGTGKSATVKAVCREYRDRGLRLLELRKEDMAAFPAVLEFTASRGLRFIIFIDDLAFENMDDSFTSLKALLEGSVETRPPNTLIYATSNRRHFVKERMADQPYGADAEVRSFDTMQEQLSLADRFGLTVIFTTPSQEEYLNIACFIAEKRGLKPDEPFRQSALRWERWFNGRSPRTASQFVDWAAAGMAFPWE